MCQVMRPPLRISRADGAAQRAGRKRRVALLGREAADRFHALEEGRARRRRAPGAPPRPRLAAARSRQARSAGLRAPARRAIRRSSQARAWHKARPRQGRAAGSGARGSRPGQSSQCSVMLETMRSSSAWPPASPASITSKLMRAPARRRRDCAGIRRSWPAPRRSARSVLRDSARSRWRLKRPVPQPSSSTFGLFRSGKRRASRSATARWSPAWRS